MGRGAGAAIALVVGAVEILDLRIALIEVKVKVTAAIGADQQAGKHIVFSIVGAALTDFAPLLLHLRIHSTLDDRLMDVLEHHPILTVIVDSLLILVGFGISFEIENVTTVFLQGENFGYCGAVPLGRRLLFALAGAFDALREPVGPRGQDIVLFKLGGNLLCSEPLQSHAVNAAHNLGCLVIHDPMLRIIRVLDVTIGRLAHRLTGIALDLIADAPLFADIAGIPLVEQVADRGKLIFALCRVDVIRNGHQADIMVREKFFRQPSDLNVVSPQAGKVFDKDGGGFSLFQLADHFYKTRAIHRHAGNAVIQKMNQICVALFLCDFGKQFLLIADAVAFAFKIIVTGKPFIEKGGHVTGFFVIRLFHKSSFRQGSRIANILVRTHYTAICCLCQPGLKAIYSFSLSDFIRRRRTLPRVSGLSSLKTGSTTNDRLPM